MNFEGKAGSQFEDGNSLWWKEPGVWEVAMKSSLDHGSSNLSSCSLGLFLHFQLTVPMHNITKNDRL